MNAAPDEVCDEPSRRFLPKSSGAVALVSAVAGLAVSTYLTVEHYDRSVGLACPENATINCVKVTTSSYSVIVGIPVALLGLLYFVGMTALLLIPSQRRELRTVRILGAAAGVAMVLYLVYVELFEVDAICLWCTAVHALTIVLFGAILWQSLADQPPRTISR